MKKIIISLALVFTTTQVGYNQSVTPPISTFRDIQDSSFHYLDKSRITSGVLLDRVKNWIDFSRLNGSRPIYTSQVRQAWHELQLASYTPTSAATMDRVRVLHNYHKEHNVITVGYLQMEYQQIDSNALHNGSLVINSQDSMLRDGNLSLNP